MLAPMSDPRHALGLAAESATERWLTAAGWQVLGRRWRPTGGGEVDLAALDPDGVLVVIEVRARRSSRSGPAAASVDARRVRRLRRSLALIAASTGRPHRGLRVDLVAAEPVAGSPRRWRLVRTPGIG
jgi:Holliday junction resolvase-like predicted endonuclease